MPLYRLTMALSNYVIDPMFSSAYLPIYACINMIKPVTTLQNIQIKKTIRSTPVKGLFRIAVSNPAAAFMRAASHTNAQKTNKR